MSELDKILGINQHGLKGKVQFTTDRKEAIKNLFLDIVGEDLSTNPNEFDWLNSGERYATQQARLVENGLKAKLREKIKKL